MDTTDIEKLKKEYSTKTTEKEEPIMATSMVLPKWIGEYRKQEKLRFIDLIAMGVIYNEERKKKK